MIVDIKSVGKFFISNTKLEKYQEFIEYFSFSENIYIAKLIDNHDYDDVISMEEFYRSRVYTKKIIQNLISLLKEHNKNYVFISSLSEFIEELKTILNDDKTSYFRGVSYFGYLCYPSLFHNKKFMVNEEKLYKDFYARFPSEFQGKTRLDTLATMQHYGLPTRLLDDTENPLVALYMACNKVFNEYWTKDLPGEVMIFNPDDEYIKYFDSESVLILSSLPLISFNSKEKLFSLLTKNDNLTLHDIKETDYELYLEFSRVMKKADPVFDDGTKLKVLLNAYFVKSSSINDRIIAQSGAFIICGLDHKIIERKFRNKEKRLFIINKDHILNELSKINISDETMLRDLDHVAKYLKNYYSR